MKWKAILAHAALASIAATSGSAAEVRKSADARQTTESPRAAEPAAPSLPANFGEGEYRLGAEDRIQFHVWKEPDLSTTVVVRPDGKISLPLIGEIEAVGKTVVQIQDETTRRLKQYVTDPMVTVIVTEVNSPKVSVLGQVKRPDVYSIKQRVTVLDAIAMAGGFTEYANRDSVVIIRAAKWGVQRIKLNLKPLIKDGRSSLPYVQPADTIYVE
jgi:polysaccharide export outer membrane protein